MKCLRWTGGFVVGLIGLGAAVQIFPETPRQETPRHAAWRLAKDAIKDGPRPGVPDFVNWATAREVYPCEGGSGGSPQPPATRDLFDESFHYNLKAASRLCGPLTRAPGAPKMDRALSFWERSSPKASTIDPSFPSGAQLSAAFWNPVRLPLDSSQGKIVELPVRSGDQTITRRIRITIPERVRAGSASCGPPTGQGQPASAGVKDVSLDDFFWVRLNRGERYNGASCGDFAVLVAFHLVHKDQGKWLWTTFWWDPESQEFGAGRPRDFQGAGDHPHAWANYAMDASFDSTGVIFNPWRIEERGTNCARCHAEVTVHSDATRTERISFDSVTAARAHFK
jgi:hypothetical protein